MAIFGDGQKDSYDWKDVWRFKQIPEHVAYDLFVAANTGKMGSKERIEEIDEVASVARLNYPHLFRPRMDFERFPERASECFEKNRYVGWKNVR